ncbi:cAMP-independent regulatory protein pac2, putative [Rhizoctonia solani AG-3 Rhs1AP]|uniref:cAMP-independent regulatory protein pac2, putative n=2 Tax=Rhizoctonia solani AG-3 TaxID=1086053 RepID=X8JNE2_9AGAM|nr:cAMP-independent regulatory protein pac2, putative [Rhizoctonia solani AG-3 Rhs1AP]KEP51862.1 putative cAMP-independent regulatory protein pac2 [Rhizoctonia solani 123E]
MSPSSTSSPSSRPEPVWTEPPCSWFIETTEDALLILEAARRGLIPRVTRRLVDRERRMITSGSVFVFDEDESGIKRWTDGLLWSPSRILGNFLLYRETDKKGTSSNANAQSASNESPLLVSDPANTSPPSRKDSSTSLSRPKDGRAQADRNRERALVGSLTNSYKFKPDGMMKKTFSLTVNGSTQHLISYYKVADVEEGRLRTPSSLPELSVLDISPEYLDKTHFRCPPKVEVDADGVPRYRGEADDPDSPVRTAVHQPPQPTHLQTPSQVPLLTTGAPEAHSHFAYSPSPGYYSHDNSNSYFNSNSSSRVTRRYEPYNGGGSSSASSTASSKRSRSRRGTGTSTRAYGPSGSNSPEGAGQSYPGTSDSTPVNSGYTSAPQYQGYTNSYSTGGSYAPTSPGGYYSSTPAPVQAYHSNTYQHEGSYTSQQVSPPAPPSSYYAAGEDGYHSGSSYGGYSAPAPAPAPAPPHATGYSSAEWVGRRDSHVAYTPTHAHASAWSAEVHGS